MRRLSSPIHDQLLELISKNRFATTHQLVRLTQGRYGNKRSAMRQTLRHLNALRAQHLIVQLERRVGGWQGGSTVTIWTLTTTGLRYLTGTTARLRPHHYSTTFLEHLLAITETQVVLHEVSEQHPELQIRTTGEPECWRRYLNTHGMTVTLKPDLAVEVASPEFLDRYLLEIDRATENPARVMRKCWQYVFHRRSGSEQERNDGIYPFVVWIVPHATRKLQLQRALDTEPKLPKELFTVITPAELTFLIRDGPPTLQ